MIHAKHIIHAMDRSPEDLAKAAIEAELCECAVEFLFTSVNTTEFSMFLAGVLTARYVQPLTGASVAELEYIAACIRLSNDVAPPAAVSGEAAIITDGILGRLQMAIDRA